MKALTIAFYELKKLFRDSRLMVIVISQPIVIALIVGLVADHEPRDIKVGLINKQDNVYSRTFTNILEKSDKLSVKKFESVDLNEIKNSNVRAFITTDISDQVESRGTIEVQNDPSGSEIELVAGAEIAKAVKETTTEMAKKNTENKIKNDLGKVLPSNQIKLTIDGNLIDPLTINISDASPFKLKMFDYYASAIMVLLILLVVLNLSGISITTERVNGTFERLFVTPYSKLDVIFGKALAQIVVGIFVAFIGVLSLYFMFNVALGSIYLIILINFLVVLLAVTLGLLISSITYSVVESVELAMYAFFITVLTVSIFSPIESANKYLVAFMKISPFYYATDASRRINMNDAGWANVATNVYILIAYFLLFLALSIILLRREAK